MPEGGPAFVHHLGLPLRIKILRHLAHDAHHLALPGLQQRSGFFDKVQQIFLWFRRKTHRFAVFAVGLAARNGAPQIVDLQLLMFLALALAQFFLRQRQLGRALVAVHAVVHQRMARIQQHFHRIKAITLFALAEVVAGKHQVINDGRGVGPGAEQIIALEKTVVAIGGVGNHQRLHGHRVFFHQIRNARIGVDHNLVSQAHLAALVAFFGGDKLLAKAPVVIVHRHADRRIGVHHLLGGDDFQLVGVDVQPIFAHGDVVNGPVVGFDQLESPFRAGGDRGGHDASSLRVAAPGVQAGSRPVLG